MTNQFVEQDTEVNAPTPIQAGPDIPSAPIAPAQPPPQAIKAERYNAPQWQPTAPRAAPPPYVAPESVYEPESSSFNPRMYNDRFKQIAAGIAQSQNGQLPTPGIMHDFTRSGIPSYNLQIVYRQMLKDAATDHPYGQEAHQFTVSDLGPDAVTTWMPGDLQDRVLSKKLIVYPNAPFSGLRYSPATGAILYNPQHEGRPEDDMRQLVKAALSDYSPQELQNFLTTISQRGHNLSPAMDLIQNQDYAGAVEEMMHHDQDIADLVHDQMLNKKVSSGLLGVKFVPTNDIRSFNLPPGYSSPHGNIYTAFEEHIDQPLTDFVDQFQPTQAVIGAIGGASNANWDKLTPDERGDYINAWLGQWGAGSGGAAAGGLFVGGELKGGLALAKLSRVGTASSKLAQSLRLAGREAEATRFAKNSETVSGLQQKVTEAQTTVKTLDDRISQLGQPETYHYHGSPAENVPAIRRTGQVGLGPGHNTYLTPDINQAASHAGEGGSIFAVKTSELNPAKLAKQAAVKPGSLAWRIALKHEGSFNYSFEVPQAGATKAENAAIKQDLTSQWQAAHQATVDMRNTPQQEALTQEKLTDKITKAQETLSQLQTSNFSNISAARAQAEAKVNIAKKALEEHMTKPSAFSEDALNDLVRQEQQVEAALGHHIRTADLPAPKGVTALRQQFDAIRKQLSNVGAYNSAFRGADIIDEQMATLVQKQIDLDRQIVDATNPMNHFTAIRKTLANERVDAINTVMDHVREAQQMENQLLDMAAGRAAPTGFRETGTIMINNWHDVQRFAQIDPKAIISANAMMLQNARVMGERLFNEMHQMLSPEDRRIFIDAVEDPSKVKMLSPGGRQALTDLKALFADSGFLLKDEELVKDLVDNYFPHFDAGTQRIAKSQLVGFRGELPTTAPYLKPRQLEEGGKKIGPEAQVKAYFTALSRVHANRQVKEVLKESSAADGSRLFIGSSEVKAPPVGDPSLLPESMTKGHQYEYRPTLGGWVQKETARQLDQILAPNQTLKEAGAGLAAFNNWYKKYAMFIPTIHYFNQLSAIIGVNPWIAVRSLVGKSPARDPNILNDASKYMFVQGNRQIADVAQKLVLENPTEREFAEAMGFITPEANIPLLSPTKRLFDHFLWDMTVRNNQIDAWVTLTKRLMSRGLAEKDAKSAAGVLAQQITGIQNPKLLQGWEKLLRDHILFAYSWDKKHVTIPLEAIPFIGRKFAQKFTPELTDIQAKAVESIARRYLIRYTTTATLALTALQRGINGTFPWQNENGHWWDLEWTNLHDYLFGSDGKRHYVNFPLMNFARFYLYKAQLFQDNGPLYGLTQNVANIAMPIPSILLNTLPNIQHESLADVAGYAGQTVDPFDRNLLGPVLKNFEKVQQGKMPFAEAATTTVLSAIGIHTYQGPHTAFIQTDQQLAHLKAIDMYIALHMNRPALGASQETKNQAEQEMLGSSLFGVHSSDLSEAAAVAGGGFLGSGSPLAGLQQELNQKIYDAVTENGFLTDDQIKKANRDSESLWTLLTPIQKQTIRSQHPEIQWAFDARSDNSDIHQRDIHDATAQYFSGLTNISQAADDKEKQIDARGPMGDHSLTGTEWRAARKENRSTEVKKIEGLKESSNYKLVQEGLKEKYTGTTTSPEDIAYAEYHAISLDNPTYENKNFTQNISKWQQDRQNYMNTLPIPTQQYIKAKDNQYRTDTEKLYEQAATEYGTFLDSHSYLVNLENQAMQMGATERRIYLELHPEVKAFMGMRDTFYRTHPLVSMFYHPLDQDQFHGMPLDVQAVKLADWVIEYRIGHPDYLTAWQRSLIENKKALAEAVSNWTDSQLALYYAYIQQEEIDYRNRISGRRKASPYKAYGGAKNYYNHQYNVPFNQQNNVFSNTPPAAWNQKSIF